MSTTLPNTVTRRGRLLTTDPATHELVDADDTPIITLELNGAANGTAVTVASAGTGEYRYSYSLNGFAAGDQIHEIAVLIIGGEVYKEVNSVIVQPLVVPADSSISAAKFAAGAVDAAALAANAATEIATAVETAILNEGDLSAVLEAIRLKIEESDDDLTTSLIANAVRDAIFDRVLSGNHDTAGTTGLLLQQLVTRLGAPAGASLAADVAAIMARTDVATSSRLSPATPGRTVALDADGKVTTANPFRVVTVEQS